MATATSTLTIDSHPYGVDNTQRRTIYYGTCALSGGGTYVTNGIPLLWSGMSSASGSFIPAWGPATTQPHCAYFFTKLGGTYQYVFDQTHNTLRIFNGGTELANAAAITADTIGFEAEFVRGI